MDDLDSLTVAELKQLLKEKSLPVSGKKAELIARLELGEKFIHLYDEDEGEEGGENVSEVKKPSEDKVEMDCPSCDARFRVPSDYSGKVKCPACNHSLIFDASEIETPSTSFRVPLFPSTRGGLAEGENFRWSHYWLGFFSPSFMLWLLYALIPRMQPDLGLSLASIFGIGLSIHGHATGNRALKFGTLTGLVVVPLIFIVGCFAWIIIFDPFAGLNG